jgi:ATP-dependent DNA helicase RecG
LAFGELFPLQVRSKLLRQKLSEQESRPVKFFQEETKKFVIGLKFNLTGDQKKSAWEILKDLQLDRPMNRLLEGDVGSGKTLVAIMAMYNTALNSYQSAMMAPTEILARQHYETIYKILSGLGVNVGLVTSSQKIINGESVSKEEFLKKCKTGKIDIVVGTQALIQKDLKFQDLALAIVDEQHRFGVEQRRVLKEKGEKYPHYLSLTATPIPRSLALTVYGDLDLSIIREMPAGRKTIVTKIVENHKRHLAYQFIAEQIDKGRQAFVVCPLIDVSDKLGVRSAKEEFEKLKKEVFKDKKIGLMHGRLKSEEKEAVIKSYSAGEIDLLVSTSVIEVGIDVPNATVMMIEGAERFGLAQLHQFRGRVGRGEHQSYCFLFSDNDDGEVLKRLQPLTESQDGFVLAQKDLEFRGAGAIYGYAQSGMVGFDLKIADLKDLDLIKKVRASAEKFVAENKIDDYPLLKEKIDSLDFSDHLE